MLVIVKTGDRQVEAPATITSVPAHAMIPMVVD